MTRYLMRENKMAGATIAAPAIKLTVIARETKSPGS
jgi:hypothetical protein